jgi:hypothetical protein
MTPFSIAHHEAGHAVSMLALGLRFDRCELYREPIDGRMGRVWVRRHITNPFWRIAISLSGPIAEHYVTGRHIDDTLHGRDFTIAQDAWRQLPAHDRLPLNSFLARSARLINEHWPQVEALANALIQYERVGYDSSKKLAMDAMPGRGRPCGWRSSSFTAFCPA